jgi:hypothetical protein
MKSETTAWQTCTFTPAKRVLSDVGTTARFVHCGCMPLFYFDVIDDGAFARDEEGTELPDLDAAEREAATTAAEIGRDRLPIAPNHIVIIEVRNEHGQRVLTVTVGLHVARHGPPPHMKPAANVFKLGR